MKRTIVGKSKRLVTVAHYIQSTQLKKNPILKLNSVPFDVATVFNRLRTNCKLIGQELGKPDGAFERKTCSWCRDALVDADHYLWGCSSYTVEKLRKMLLHPKGNEEMEKFLALQGHTNEAKEKVYRKTILSRHPEKVIAFITARLCAERRNKTELEGALPTVEGEEEDDEQTYYHFG